MHTTRSIVIKAPREKIFPMAADLPNWPRFLLHYRENRYLSKLSNGGIIKMSAVRTGIPLSWVSIYNYDAVNYQMHFEHLKPATRGMIVRWDMKPVADATEVSIVHDFTLSWPLIGGFVANTIIGSFLVDYVAGLTLAGLKKQVEKTEAES